MLEKNKARLADEFDRKMVEMREASRRLKEEYQHQLQLEKNKQKDVDDRYGTIYIVCILSQLSRLT